MSEHTTSPDLGIDPSTLNESERQLLDIFERRATTSSADDGGLASAEELADTTGTPGPAVGSTAAPEPPTTVEGPSGGSETEPSVSSPVSAPATPVEGEATGDEPVLPAPAFTFAGVDYSPHELAESVIARDWIAQLNNGQRQQIDAVLSGQYRLVSAHEAEPASPAASATQPPPATSPASSVATAPSLDDAGEWLDPRAAAEITQLRAQLDSMQQQWQQQFQGTVTPLVQTQADQQLQARVQSIDTATAAFRDAYQLDEDTVKSIGDAVVQAGVLPSLFQRHNGDIETATRQAFEMMFWTTPTFRDAHLQAKTAADLASLSAQDADTVRKQQQLTALANSGGSVPRRDPVPSTKEDRHSAMVELIRADMNGS